MAELGVHPRLAHLLRVAAARGVVPLGAAIAALLSDRDLLRSAGGPRDSDALLRLDALQGGGAAHAAGFDVDRAALQRLRAAAAQFARQLGPGDRPAPARSGGQATAAAAHDATTPAVLLACAYPDRVAQRRPGAAGRFLLANGRGAAFAQPERLAQSPCLVVLDLDDAEREARILLAAAITPEEIEAALGDVITITDEVGWSTREQAVVARRVRRLDALVLGERALSPPPAEAARAAMLAGVREMGLGALPWTDEARALQARVAFARRHALPGPPEGGWPDLGNAALLATLEQWLGPWLDGVTRRSHLAGLPLLDALRARVGHDALRRLDGLAPTHLALPTGSRVRIDYADELAPSASMRMQEVFGLATTPRIGGDVPVTFKLLSPAQRPLQVTRDLASFWVNAYRDVRKDMRGRYPRHYWPENPLVAEPVRGTRRRS
jgi:ATP-dependent helicase HrpB